MASEVRNLAAKVDQVASAAEFGIFATLEQRIATIADALEKHNQACHPAPRQMDTAREGFGDRIGRLSLAQADFGETEPLHAQIAALADKLDASGTRFDQFATIERDLAEILVVLKGPHAVAEAVPSPLWRRPTRSSATCKRLCGTVETIHQMVSDVLDQLATIRNRMPRGFRPWRFESRRLQVRGLPRSTGPGRPRPSPPRN